MDDVYNLQQCASPVLTRHGCSRKPVTSVVVFMNKYLICTVKFTALEPHEGVPLELAQFKAFPYPAAPTKGECTKGLLL
jgi:hypothetical protein